MGSTEKPKTRNQPAQVFATTHWSVVLAAGGGDATGAREAIDVRLDEVVLRALEKEPQRRYQQASMLKTQVETIASTPPVKPPRKQRCEGPASGIPSPIAADILFLLPLLLPLAMFLWFLLAGHRTLGVDLDADVQAFTGLLGLPLSAGVGAVLAWAIEMFRPSLDLASDEVAPANPQRWCWQAIVGVVLLVVSLPLGGGAIVLFQLGAQDVEGWRGWNPGTEELVVTLSLFGGTFLTAAAATLLGIEALRQVRRASEPLRGRWGALAASWFWPCMLVALAITLLSWERHRQQRAKITEKQAEMAVARASAWREASSEEKRQEAMADVADIPAQDLKVEGNDRMRYFLIGPRENVVPPKSGFKLVIVMPGGDGGEDSHPFVRRIYKHVMNDEFLVAQPVAFKWQPPQMIVWPTRVNPVNGQEFSTEDFVEAVIRDVAGRHSLDQRYVFTLSWSSSGPAAYALALKKETPIRGSYVAMSV